MDRRRPHLSEAPCWWIKNTKLSPHVGHTSLHTHTHTFSPHSLVPLWQNGKSTVWPPGGPSFCLTLFLQRTEAGAFHSSTCLPGLPWKSGASLWFTRLAIVHTRMQTYSQPYSCTTVLTVESQMGITTLSILKDVPLRTRRALSLYDVYGNSALLVFNGTSLNSDSTVLALNWWFNNLERNNGIQ